MAGPTEIFDYVYLAPQQPDTLLLQYRNGGGGSLLSHDGGKTFALICGSFPDRSLLRSAAPVWTNAPVAGLTASGATMFVGGSGLWMSDNQGCGYVGVGELAGQYVEAVTHDPVNPQLTYAVTGNPHTPGKPANSVWAHDDASGVNGPWTRLGTETPDWLESINVAKMETGRRFWTTKVVPTPSADIMNGAPSVRYYARFSDDEGATWTEHEYAPLHQFGPETQLSTFVIIAVEPNNPNAIYALVSRPSDGEPDDLLYSAARGEAGSWRKIAAPTIFGGLASPPDGKVYFADGSPTTRGLFVLDSPTDAPRQLTDKRAFNCLFWDEPRSRMLACESAQLGSLNLQTMDFDVLYDARCGGTLAACEGITATCEVQMRANWCDLQHWPKSPPCSAYDIKGADLWSGSAYDCRDGDAVLRSVSAGAMAAAMSGSGGASGVTAGAGPADSPSTLPRAGSAASGGTAADVSTSGTAGAAPSPPTKAGGCQVSVLDTSRPGAAWPGALLLLLARRKRTRP